MNHHHHHQKKHGVQSARSPTLKPETMSVFTWHSQQVMSCWLKPMRCHELVLHAFHQRQTSKEPGNEQTALPSELQLSSPQWNRNMTKQKKKWEIRTTSLQKPTFTSTTTNSSLRQLQKIIQKLSKNIGIESRSAKLKPQPPQKKQPTTNNHPDLPKKKHGSQPNLPPVPLVTLSRTPHHHEAEAIEEVVSDVNGEALEEINRKILPLPSYDDKVYRWDP